MSQIQAWVYTMKTGEQDFFIRLGERITQIRKERGMTQVELASLLNLRQQALASYEVGRRRLPTSMLPEVAKALGVEVEELLGEKNGNGKRGPTPKLQQQVEQITRLPRAKQRFVSELLETVLHKANS
jgi:transcriptional regulator with XRE-family HTH domain